jgi:RNA polymerase sigma-70 factor (ECF subfamily)
MQPAIVQVTEVVAIDEVALVRRARAGDAAAFEALAAASLAGAYRLASAILGDQSEAADATQNALIAAWRELPRLRDEHRFAAWFHRILVNECRMRVRARGRVREVGLEGVGELAYRAGPAGDTLDRVEILDVLEAAFEQLDADDRAMVVMHHLEGMSVEEMMDALGLRKGTVISRLARGRDLLKRKLAKEMRGL